MRIILAGMLTLLFMSDTADVHASNGIPIPQGYEQAVNRLPPEHWALVRSAIVDPTAHNSSSSQGDITLLPYQGDRTLWHEVGHVFMYTHPEISRAWAERFWPNGRQAGTPITSYARTSPAEDQAESYEWYMQDGSISDLNRSAFLRDHVFGHRPLTIAAPAPQLPVPARQATQTAGPCDRPGIASGSIVAGCSFVPNGSVR